MSFEYIQIKILSTDNLFLIGMLEFVKESWKHYQSHEKTLL